jgi:hypothetical protein
VNYRWLFIQNRDEGSALTGHFNRFKKTDNSMFVKDGLSGLNHAF